MISMQISIDTLQCKAFIGLLLPASVPCNVVLNMNAVHRFMPSLIRCDCSPSTGFAHLAYTTKMLTNFKPKKTRYAMTVKCCVRLTLPKWSAMRASSFSARVAIEAPPTRRFNRASTAAGQPPLTSRFQHHDAGKAHSIRRPRSGRQIDSMPDVG